MPSLVLVPMIALFVVGVYAKLWIVGTCAALIALSFTRYKEMEGLLPMCWLAGLGAGFGLSQAVWVIRHWPTVSGILGEFFLR